MWDLHKSCRLFPAMSSQGSRSKIVTILFRTRVHNLASYPWRRLLVTCLTYVNSDRASVQKFASCDITVHSVVCIMNCNQIIKCDGWCLFVCLFVCWLVGSFLGVCVCMFVNMRWCRISRKQLEIEARFQRTTNRKWHMENRMVTWSMASRDSETSRSWLDMFPAKYLENNWRYRYKIQTRL